MNRIGASSADYYDALWARTRRLDQHHKCRIRAIRNMLDLTPVPIQRQRHILEPGCGMGLISSVLAEFGEVTGVDQSMVGIMAAREAVPGTFFLAELPDIPVTGTEYDVCVLSQVLEHFLSQEQESLLRNIHEQTCDNGHLILTTPNRPVSIRMYFQPGELQPIENWLSLEDIQELLKKTGWRTLHVRYAFSFFPILTSRYRWLRVIRFLLYDILKLRNLIESLMERRPLGDCIVILAQKPSPRPAAT